MTAISIDLIVGTYAGSGGRGLYPLSYDPRADRWAIGAPIEHVVNASFGVHAPMLGVTYCVEECSAGAVAGYDTADGWRRIGVASTGGGAPCHVAVHPSARWLAVANYQDGSVAILALDPDTGAPSGPAARYHTAGSGPDPERQAGPHPHWVGFTPDGETLYCVDLGADRILAFAFDGAAGALSAATVAHAAPGGSGPRHLLFHPHLPQAFLISEMAATVTVLHRDGANGFAAGFVLPTGAGDGMPGNLVGGMALNRAADRLYVTNRGDDDVAVFTVDRGGGLALVDRISSGGRSPRFVFVLDDQARLLVAHEGGQAVTAFTIHADGTLTDPIAIAIPGAAFIAFAHPRSG